MRGKSHSVHGVVSTVRPVRLSLSLNQRNELKPIDGLRQDGGPYGAAASMPVQIIRGSGARHQGSPPPSRPQHVEQPAPLGHSLTHPPTHPSHAPSVSKISTGLGCLVQIAGHMAWSVQTLPTGVGCPNLSSHQSHGWRPHGRGSLSKTFLTWTGSPNLPHGRGALPNHPWHGLAVRPPHRDITTCSSQLPSRITPPARPPPPSWPLTSPLQTM